MKTRRRPIEPIELPDRLEEQIAALVGQRGRDAFVREAVQQELDRRRLLATMPKTKPSRSAKPSKSAARRP